MTPKGTVMTDDGMVTILSEIVTFHGIVMNRGEKVTTEGGRLAMYYGRVTTRDGTMTSKAEKMTI